MGDKRSKKDKRDQGISAARISIGNEVELERAKVITKAGDLLKVNAITLDMPTEYTDEKPTNSESKSATHRRNKWEPKLSFSSAEIKAQKRAESRLRRRAVMT